MFIKNLIRTRLSPRTYALSPGFTLIELLIVISIIGVLSAFVTANLMGARTKARDVQRKSELRQLQAAFELYRSDHGAYPDSPLPNCGEQLVTGNSIYIQKIPCDPLDKKPYNFFSTGTTYSLVTCLENTSDPQKDRDNNTAYCAGGTTNWSYTLVNP